MTRSEALGSTLALIAVLFWMVTLWMNPSGVWLAAIGGVLAVPLYALMWRPMRKYEDERIRGIMDLSMRNGFLFLFFALPLTTLALLLESVASGAVAVVVLVWFLALLTVSVSKIYYER